MKNHYAATRLLHLMKPVMNDPIRYPERNQLKIAVLLDVSRPIDPDVLAGIGDFNKLYYKFQFFFYTPKYVDRDDRRKLINRIIAWRPDGILTRERGELVRLLQRELPLIVITQTNLYEDPIHLWTDNKVIGGKSAKHFLTKGCQQVK
ncbi:hypothetical protein V9K67_00630 [Paraflavisolibacter sp. H34]|uniref:hypothetical protein n=1 Tax=Huijunlia imazamoxiresistens TaxID=3127457 RepID=UPI0030182D87